jgi:hypothetical protein
MAVLSTAERNKPLVFKVILAIIAGAAVAVAVSNAMMLLH